MSTAKLQRILRIRMGAPVKEKRLKAPVKEKRHDARYRHLTPYIAVIRGTPTPGITSFLHCPPLVK